jgi:tetratricopeptide (TPR) repeat protein
LYQSALAVLTDTTGAEPLRVTLLARCAEVAVRGGNGVEAEQLAQQGLERARATGSRASMAFLLRIIAQAAGDRGDLTVGDTQYRVALKLAEEVGDVDTAMSCRQNMGAIAFKRGQFGHAILLLNHGLRQAKAIGHIRRVAAMLNALGCVYVKLASCPQLRRQAIYDERAEQSLTSCLQLATRYHLPLWQNHAAQNLGALERGRGNFEQAEERLREALTIAEQMGDRWIIAETECELGELYLEMGQDDQAQAAFERAIAIASEYDNEEAELLAWADYGLGRVWAARGDGAKARDCGEQSRSRFEKLQFEQAAEVQRWLDTLGL